jgi:hypothetical protein
MSLSLVTLLLLYLESRPMLAMLLSGGIRTFRVASLALSIRRDLEPVSFLLRDVLGLRLGR